MALPLNNSFESWSSPGTPGITSGVCDNWTNYSVNGGTSTRQTDAPTDGGTYSVNIRSNSSGNVSSIGGIISELFYLANNNITFWEKSENANVRTDIKIFDEYDNQIGWWYISSPYVGYWGRWRLPVDALMGQNIKIRFEQHTTQEAYGYYTLIDLVQVKTRSTILSDAEVIPSWRQYILSNAHIKKIEQKTILSDAEVIPSWRQYINSDSKIKILNNQKTILSDTKIMRKYQQTILSDSSIKVTGIKKTILSNAKIIIQVLKDINNKFNFCKQTLKDINNKFTFVVQVVSDIENYINTCKAKIYDVVNDFRTKKLTLKNINNDIRFIKTWQVPVAGAVGFQSLGKSYIHVYIGGIEQTDIDVDSINIGKGKDSSHTASFELARVYDGTEPVFESTVEIKYNNWTLYSGYVITTRPSANPEFITVECSNEHWKQNKNNVYFHVGHEPKDNKEKYYETIQEALSSEFGWNLGIGNFVPETMDCFAVGKSDAITSLIQNCGNYGWFYDVNNNKILWQAGEGSIITIERQTIGKNIGLYQLLDHTFTKSIENIVNKYRVQMGEKVIRKLDDKGGTRQYAGYNYYYYNGFLEPAWDVYNERLAKPGGVYTYGWNYHKPEDNDLYKDVFKKYKLPYLNPKFASWTDWQAPLLTCYSIPTNYKGYNVKAGRITEGYTIDYENGIITFSEPVFCIGYDDYGSAESIRSIGMSIKIFKKQFYTYTENPTEDPETDISNPLMFFTDKMGSYPETILKDLDLTNLSIQIGGITYNTDGEMEVIPSWDDTEYAKDFVNWQLSKICDEKISGSIELTLDAVCFYGIDLSKRIYINGITDSPMNITAMNYNISDFTVKLTLENSRGFRRTVSLPTRGE